MAAQLADSLAEAVEIGTGHDSKGGRSGQRTPGDESKRAVRFRELLLRVVDEPGVEDVWVFRQAGFCLLEVALGLREQSFSRVELAAVHGPDRVRRQTNHLARKGKRLLARLMLGVEVRTRLVRDDVEAVGVQTMIPSKVPSNRSIRRKRLITNPRSSPWHNRRSPHGAPSYRPQERSGRPCTAAECLDKYLCRV